MSEQRSESRSLRVLVEGGRYFEGPRWHANSLWVSDTLARTVLRIGISKQLAPQFFAGT